MEGQAMKPLLALLLYLASTATLAVETDLLPESIGYLASSGVDEVSAVGIQPDGHIVLAGRIGDPDENFGLTPRLFALGGGSPGGQGVVLRLSPDGRELVSISRLGERIDHLALDPNTARIAITSAQGIALLDPQASEMLWSYDAHFHPDIGRIDRTPQASSGRRIAVGTDGTVAALFNRNVAGNDTHAVIFVFDRYGEPVGELPLVEDRFFYNQRFEDIAVDAQHGTVLLAGWRQAHPSLQAPFLVARRYRAEATDRGEAVWTAFNWWKSAADTQNLQADSRALRIHRGADHQFYLAGDVHGGDNRFTRKAVFDGAVTSSNPAAQSNNINLDGYSSHAHSQMTGFRGSYLARINPATGEVSHGQFFHVRSAGPTSEKRRWTTEAIAADQQGRLLFAGSGSFHFPCSPETYLDNPGTCQGQTLRINGSMVGPYFGNEPGMVVLSSDFSAREQLAKLNLEGSGPGEIAPRPRAVARCNATSVMVSQTDYQLSTFQGLQDMPDGQSIYLTVWRHDTADDSDVIFADRFEGHSAC